MFPIILVFILTESVDQSNNPTSRRNMNSCTVIAKVHPLPGSQQLEALNLLPCVGQKNEYHLSG